MILSKEELANVSSISLDEKVSFFGSRPYNTIIIRYKQWWRLPTKLKYYWSLTDVSGGILTFNRPPIIEHTYDTLIKQYRDFNNR